MITRKEIDVLFQAYGDHIKFNMSVPWNETSVTELNDYLEEYVEDGHLLCGIDYDLIGCDVPKQEVIVEVMVGDMSEYFHPDNYMDDDLDVELFED